MRQISVKDMAYPGFGENPGLADEESHEQTGKDRGLP